MTVKNPADGSTDTKKKEKEKNMGVFFVLDLCLLTPPLQAKGRGGSIKLYFGKKLMQFFFLIVSSLTNIKNISFNQKPPRYKEVGGLRLGA